MNHSDNSGGVWYQSNHWLCCGVFTGDEYREWVFIPGLPGSPLGNAPEMPLSLPGVGSSLGSVLVQALNSVPLSKVEQLSCNPWVLGAFDHLVRDAGQFEATWEAAVAINRNADGTLGFDYSRIDMDRQASQTINVRSVTVAIAHTHPSPIRTFASSRKFFQTPSPADLAATVPNYVITRQNLYATIPRQNRFVTVRSNYAKCD